MMWIGKKKKKIKNLFSLKTVERDGVATNTIEEETILREQEDRYQLLFST